MTTVLHPQNWQQVDQAVTMRQQSTLLKLNLLVEIIAWLTNSAGSTGQWLTTPTCLCVPDDSGVVHGP